MTGGLDHLIVEGATLADARFHDRWIQKRNRAR